MRSQPIDPKVAVKSLESFILKLEQEMVVPSPVQRACKKDREFWRKTRGEGILQPGNHRRYVAELQDELVDFMNYTYFVLFLIEQATDPEVVPPEDLVSGKKRLKQAVNSVIDAWEEVEGIEKLVRKRLDAADKSRGKAG